MGIVGIVRGEGVSRMDRWRDRNAFWCGYGTWDVVSISR